MQNTLCRRRCHHACVFLYLLTFEIEGRGGGGARAVEININGDLGEGNLGEAALAFYVSCRIFPRINGSLIQRYVLTFPVLIYLFCMVLFSFKLVRPKLLMVSVSRIWFLKQPTWVPLSPWKHGSSMHLQSLELLSSSIIWTKVFQVFEKIGGNMSIKLHVWFAFCVSVRSWG